MVMDILQPKGWPRPPGFSNGTAADGKHVFVAGQVGDDPISGQMHPEFAGQCQQALANVLAVLAEAGAGPEHVVKLTWFVTSLAQYRAAGRALGDAWKATMGRHFPAITLIEVTGLIAEGAMVEIEAHAVVPR
jgi:enamine deaminase RidA (YjgF/YER057c/UK114 family)